VRVGTYKRNLVLPQSLQRLEVRGANFVGNQLEIVFAKAPASDASETGRSARG
jgi:hypothetical protein